MDTKAIIAITLAVLTLVFWQLYYVKKYQPPVRDTVVTEEGRLDVPVAPEAVVDAAPQATPSPAPSTSSEPQVEEETRELTTSVARYEFTNQRGGILRAVLPGHEAEDGEPVVLNQVSGIPIGALTREPGEWPAEGYAMETEGKWVVFRGESGPFQVTKRFYFEEDEGNEYIIDLDLIFENRGATPVSSGEIFVNLGSAVAIHADDLPSYTSFDWYKGGKINDTSVTWFDSGGFLGMQYREARPVYRETAADIDWAAVKNQYFTTLATVMNGEAGSVWASRLPVEHDEQEIHAIHGALGLADFTVAPGDSRTVSLRFYIGPKEYRRLKAFDQGQAEIMQFGFFKPVSIFLLKMMNWLQSKLGFYAAAICVMTLIIKTAMWPLQNAATRSMRKMQALQPKMAELREKYKDDPTRMNQELMKLYKDYGINPFGGCLPMLIQIPIFFGFYRMLGVAPELRNSSFLWIQDLSQPDTVFHIMGFPINVLPLIMALTMVWQMKITPKSGDAVQQRIFMFVPLIFVVFCYNFASALALYWTVQNLFSIVQLYATRNQEIPALKKKEPAETAAAKSAKKKKR